LRVISHCPEPPILAPWELFSEKSFIRLDLSEDIDERGMLMATKTIADLRKLREELVDRRRDEAYQIAGVHDDERIAKIAYVQLAIQALDAVIGEGWDDTPAGS
jgi:hypothetical protein